MRARSVPAHEDDLEAFPGEGWVNPLAVRDAALKTVPVLQQQVLRLEPVERGVRLHSARHTHTARAAVIAAGAWSANFGLPVYPLRGQALLLSAAPYPTPLYAAGRYAVPRAGRTYLGASVRATWDTRIEAQETEALLHGLEGIFPHLRGAAVLEARVGLRPFCDQGPLEGAHPSLPGVWCATGHGRHGTLLAPLTARRVADAVQQALAALSA
nr:FAD-dependent oxidoreductase [Deinobacterium chartae]